MYQSLSQKNVHDLLIRPLKMVVWLQDHVKDGNNQGLTQFDIKDIADGDTVEWGVVFLVSCSQTITPLQRTDK